MGCGSSSEVLPETAVPEKGDKAMIDDSEAKIKDTPLAFEISIRDGDSLIKKHPPLRFRRLEEQQLQQPKVTLKDLQQRQAEAEERRRRILDMRVQSAQHFQQKIRTAA